MEPTALSEPINIAPQPERRRSNLLSLSTISLLFANIVTIILFYQNHGSIVQVLWIYWLQSVIIGVIAVLRMATTPVQSAMGTPSLNAGLSAAKIVAIVFFIAHYGFFHLVYGIFLFAFSVAKELDINGVVHPLDLGASHLSIIAILLGGALFAAHHLISFFTERRSQDNLSIVSFGAAFAKPYARILPMHLIIIAGPVVSVYFGNTAVFIVFMILKTIADLALQLRGTSHPVTPFIMPTVNPTGSVAS